MKKKKPFTLDDLRKSKVADINKHILCPEIATDQNEYRLMINPRGKPRMVKSDAWKKRKVVLDYWAWKDELLKEAEHVCLPDLPEKFSVTFYVGMPDSWSKKKKAAHDGRPHKSKPDWDNMAKALQDCLCKSDSHVHDVHVKKRWSYNGWIKIEI